MLQRTKNIYVQDNFLTSKECDYFIDLYEKTNPKLEFGHIRYGALDMGRKQPRKKFPAMEVTDLWKRLNHMSYWLNESFLEWQHIYKFPDGSPGMKLHRDSASPITTYTSILYLNDDYDGGHTYFGEDDKETIFTSKKGRIVFFDGQHFLHGVKPISNGNRYTVASWYTQHEDYT